MYPQLPIHVKRRVGLDLQAAHALARQDDLAILNRRVELVAKGAAVAVAVAVVVAEQVLATGLAAPAHGQGLVHRRQQVLRQLWRDVDQAVQVRRRVLRVQAAEQVAGLFKISGLAGVGFIGRGRG